MTVNYQISHVLLSEPVLGKTIHTLASLQPNGAGQKARIRLNTCMGPLKDIIQNILMSLKLPSTVYANTKEFSERKSTLGRPTSVMGDDHLQTMFMKER